MRVYRKLGLLSLRYSDLLTRHMQDQYCDIHEANLHSICLRFQGFTIRLHRFTGI